MSRDVEDLRAAFDELDTSRTGSLSKADIRAGICVCSNFIAEEDLDVIFESFDTDSTGRVQYADWLAATVEPSLVSSEKAMKQVFTFFDQEQEGKIMRKQLREMLDNNPIVCSALASSAHSDDEWLSEADFKALLRDVAEDLERRCLHRNDHDTDMDAFLVALSCDM